MISGLSGLSPAMPVPCKREIFSSRVISLTTIEARASGERFAFDQGWFPVDCASAEEKENRSARVDAASAIENRGGILLPVDGIVASVFKFTANYIHYKNDNVEGFWHSLPEMRVPSNSFGGYLLSLLWGLLLAWVDRRPMP